MLDPASVLNTNLLSLPVSIDRNYTATNFINVVADFINKVQAGPLGTPGILIYNRPPAISQIEVLPLVIDNSWIVRLANAIHIGVTSGTLVPGTVTDPAWTASGTDIAASPVITNLASAYSLLVSELAAVTWYNNPALPLAQAIYDYTKSFTFLCTGLVQTGGGPVPLPLTFTAQ